MTPAAADDLIPAIYFVFVPGIGWTRKRGVPPSGDSLTSGRGVPVWITSLAFVAANLGALQMQRDPCVGAQTGVGFGSAARLAGSATSIE